jgi:Tol biopolymer transport system component
MTGQRDFDRTLTAWFENDALSPVPADGFTRVIGATRRRRPRPAWLSSLGSDWVWEPPEGRASSAARSSERRRVHWTTALILLLLIAALVGGAILVGAELLHRATLPTGRLGHLAYGLDSDIYLADWDGTNAVKIADGTPEPSAGGPNSCDVNHGEGTMWSPDGRHFAYRSTSGDRCAGVVVITDPVTKSVASFLGEGWLVSWSPDATRVATWVDLFKTVGIFGFDGGRQALLTVPTGCALGGDFDPVWSPDGTSIVIGGCLVPVDGRAPRRLPEADPRSHVQWAYSLVVARFASITTDSLVVSAVDGSQERLLATPGIALGGFMPVWSPEGDRIAYDAGPAASAPNEVRMVDLASGKVTSLASALGSDSIHVIRFSPGADRVLFSRLDANYNGTSLWSVRADGTDAQLLVSGTGWGDWQWQPLGS